MRSLTILLLLIAFSACTSTVRPQKSFVRHMRLSLDVTHEIVRLDTLAQQEHLTELQRDRIRVERSSHLTRLLDSLLEALKEENNADFSPYVLRLSEQNSVLKSMVDHYDVESLNRQIEIIDAVCTSCHQENRD